MKKVICVLLVLMCAMCGTVLCEEAEDGISWIIRLYGGALSEEAQQAMTDSFTPVSFDCGEAQVTLKNVLYDGVTLHIAAEAVPTDSTRCLVMPATAEMSNFVCGGYGEGLREDTRTFLQAAEEDGKQIVEVGAYPAEESELGVWWADHRQEAGDASTLIAYKGFGWLEAEHEMTISVEVRAYDPVKRLWGETSTYNFPVTIHALGDITTQTYYPAEESTLRFASITLVKTALTTYVYIDGAAECIYTPTLRDAEHQLFAEGMYMDGYKTLTMEELPESFYADDVLMVAQMKNE